MSSNNEQIEKRLNKFISESGYCSRREADKLIEKDRVTINGKVPELGTKVQPGDKVYVDGKLIAASPENKSDRIYIAYNKPVGITCTTERHVRGNIIDAIKHKERIFPIGRLDKPSEGLIFLTSDGDIVNKILRAENAHDKEYIVTVDKPISERFVERMSRGVPILGTITKPCLVRVQSKFVFRIILTQGLNRQIRRMCEYLGYEVTKLKRSRIMNVELGNLRPGQWRDLTKQEMEEINQAVSHSSKTAKEGTVRATKKMPAKKAEHGFSERNKRQPYETQKETKEHKENAQAVDNKRDDKRDNRAKTQSVSRSDANSNRTSNTSKNKIIVVNKSKPKSTENGGRKKLKLGKR